MPPIPKKPRERQKTFLREWRKFRKLSQETVADRIEVDRTTISRIERGESPYDQDIIEKLSLVYLCEPEDLLSIDPLKPDAPRMVYSKLTKASPEIQEKALEILNVLLKSA